MLYLSVNEKAPVGERDMSLRGVWKMKTKKPIKKTSLLVQTAETLLVMLAAFALCYFNVFSKFEKLLTDRLELLSSEYAIYHEKFGKERDPLGEIVEAYGLSDEEIDEADKMDELYHIVCEEIQNLKRMLRK